MEAVAERDPYIDAAYQRLMALSEDERKKLEYDNRMKAIWDRNTLIQQGIDEGIERGAAQKLISMVCKKMVKGKRPDTIAEELEEDREVIARIYNVAEKYAPDYDVDEIYRELYPE